MAAGGLPGWGRLLPLLLLLLLLLGPRCSAALAAPQQEAETAPPRCRTDFATALVCAWRVGAPTDCARDFRLLHSTGASREQEECVPEQEGNQCSCTLRRKTFRLVRFRLALERRESGRWKKVWNHTLVPEDVVKPRPLINLKVEKTSQSFVLSWERDYPPGSPLSVAKADYQVAYWPKSQQWKERNFTTPLPTYEIFADHLLPASDYVARVRFNLEEWGGLWSDWSTPFEWHNDLQPGVVPWKLTLWSCIPLVAMILTCYLSFTRVKRDWWDQIPSPAKSKMAQTMMMFPLVKRIPCEGKTLPPGPSKGSGKDSWNKTTATLCGPPVLQEMVSGGSGSPRPKPEVFLMPEVAVVECPLVIHSRTVTPGDQKEEGKEEPVPHQDLVVGLFRDLLSGDFSTGDAQVLEVPAAKDWGAPEGSVGLVAGGVPGAPGLPSEASSESGYQSSGVEPVAPPPLESPTGPGCCPGQGCACPGGQPGSPFLPQRSASSICPWLDGSATGGAAMLGYRSISSLVPELATTPSHEGEAAPQDLPHGGQVQLQGGHARPCGPSSGTQSAFPAGLGTPWVATGKPGDFPCAAASLLSGYRSFASALQDSSPARVGSGSSEAFTLLSPYKPLLGLLWSSSTGPAPLVGSQGAGSLAWPEGPPHATGSGFEVGQGRGAAGGEGQPGP